jgi:hypothetical protein
VYFVFVSIVIFYDVLCYVNAIPLCETCGENVVVHKSGFGVSKLFVEIITRGSLLNKSRVVLLVRCLILRYHSL